MAEPTPIQALLVAYSEYMAAPVGQLNATAEALDSAARRCGYKGRAREKEGALPWTRRALQEAGLMKVGGA